MPRMWGKADATDHIAGILEAVAAAVALVVSVVVVAAVAVVALSVLCPLSRAFLACSVIKRPSEGWLVLADTEKGIGILITLSTRLTVTAMIWLPSTMLSPSSRYPS